MGYKEGIIFEEEQAVENKIKHKPDVEFTALVLIELAYKEGLINKQTFLNVIRKYGKKYGWGEWIK